MAKARGFSLEFGKEYPRKWISGTLKPNDDQLEKLEQILDAPQSILFYNNDETLIRKKLVGANRTYKNRAYKHIKFPIVYYLTIMYGYTVKELSDTFGLDYDLFYQTIRGKRKLDKELVKKLEAIFGTHPDVLFRS